MTPSQLRTLLTVVEAGSVRAAGERLVVSQPAVSSALAGLRRELGVSLFEREGRGLRVTPAGLVLADYARRVLGLLDEAAVATVARASPERGRLRLAAVTTAGEHVVPPSLAALRARYPAVEVVLEVGNRRRVWELLAGRGVDLAVGGRPPAGGELITLARRPHELVLVARSEVARPHPSAAPLGASTGAVANQRPARPRPPPRARRVGLAELAGRTWLVREPGSGTRTNADEALDQLGIRPATLTIGSNGAIRESVRVGLGIALLSRDAVADDLAQGSLEEWQAGPIPLLRHWHLVARAGEELPGTAKLFVELVTGDPGAPGGFSADRDTP